MTYYCISKKCWPILYSIFIYKMGQDFLDRQYRWCWMDPYFYWLTGSVPDHYVHSFQNSDFFQLFVCRDELRNVWIICHFFNSYCRKRFKGTYNPFVWSWFPFTQPVTHSLTLCLFLPNLVHSACKGDRYYFYMFP